MILVRACCALVCLVFILSAAPVHAEILKSFAPRSLTIDRVDLRGADGHAPLSSVLPRGPVIVHFWATWCAPCRRELPEIADFAIELKRRGLGRHLVVISVDRMSYDHVARTLRSKFGVAGFPIWQDAEGWSPRVFRLRGVPSTVLLDTSHRMVALRSGAMKWTDPEVRAELLNAITGNPITAASY
ncbi:TlpA family protein disulfide reductase [Amorphus coralli]|uniref:TlpA family protein disulfide reductase n=1 Tax=Amorphus coralli TaxID=340680 RepID=UPI00037CFA2A|nr:TlpA disulfide reductase family protein [Amorphus coralli]